MRGQITIVRLTSQLAEANAMLDWLENQLGRTVIDRGPFGIGIYARRGSFSGANLREALREAINGPDSKRAKRGPRPAAGRKGVSADD